MKSSNENTELSPNRRNFFYLHNMGLSEEEHMRILRLQDYKYPNTAKMLSNMSIEFSTLAQDELSGKRQRPRRELRPGGSVFGRGKGASAGSSSDRPKGGRRAFLADHGDLAEDGSQGSGPPRSGGGSDVLCVACSERLLQHELIFGCGRSSSDWRPW